MTTFSSISEFDLGFVVGIIEGEGCIQSKFYEYRNRGRELSLGVKVVMTDEDTVRRLLDITGIGTFRSCGEPLQSHWKPQFAWTVSSREQVSELLLRIIPHLGERRAEAARKALAAIREMEGAAKLRSEACKSGHPRSEFRYVDGSGSQRCKACMKIQRKAYLSRLKG